MTPGILTVIAVVVVLAILGGAFAIWYFLFNGKAVLLSTRRSHSRTGGDGKIEVTTAYHSHFRPGQTLHVVYKGQPTTGLEWFVSRNHGSTFHGLASNGTSTTDVQIPARTFTTGLQLAVRRVNTEVNLGESRFFNVTPSLTATGLSFSFAGAMSLGQVLLVRVKLTAAWSKVAHLTLEYSPDLTTWHTAAGQGYSQLASTLRWHVAHLQVDSQFYLRVRSTNLVSLNYPSELSAVGTHKVTVQSAQGTGSSAGGGGRTGGQFESLTLSSKSTGGLAATVMVGDSVTVSWTTAGSLSSVSLWYGSSTDGTDVTKWTAIADASDLAVANGSATVVVTSDWAAAGATLYIRATDGSNVSVYGVSREALHLVDHWSLGPHSDPLEIKVNANNSPPVLIPIDFGGVWSSLADTSGWAAAWTNPTFLAAQATVRVSGVDTVHRGVVLEVDKGSLFASPQSPQRVASAIKFTFNTIENTTPYKIQLNNTALVDTTAEIESVTILSSWLDDKGVHISITFTGKNLRGTDSVQFSLSQSTATGTDVLHGLLLQTLSGSAAEQTHTLHNVSREVGTNFKLHATVLDKGATARSHSSDAFSILPGRSWQPGDGAVFSGLPWSLSSSLALASGFEVHLSVPAPLQWVFPAYVPNTADGPTVRLYYTTATDASNRVQVTDSLHIGATLITFVAPSALVSQTVTFELEVHDLQGLTLSYTATQVVGVSPDPRGTALTVSHDSTSTVLGGLKAFATGETVILHSTALGDNPTDVSLWYREGTTGTLTRLPSVKGDTDHTYTTRVPGGVTSASVQLVALDSGSNQLAVSGADLSWGIPYITLADLSTPVRYNFPGVKAPGTTVAAFGLLTGTLSVVVVGGTVPTMAQLGLHVDGQPVVVNDTGEQLYLTETLQEVRWYGYCVSSQTLEAGLHVMTIHLNGVFAGAPFTVGTDSTLTLSPAKSLGLTLGTTQLDVHSVVHSDVPFSALAGQLTNGCGG